MSAGPATILLAAAGPDLRSALREDLEGAGHRVIHVDDAGDVAAVVRGLAVDVLVVQGGVEWVRRAAARAGTTPWIAVEARPPAVAMVAAVLAALGLAAGGVRGST